MDDYITAAAKAGRDAGKAAASWRFDGNTPEATYTEFLRGHEDGDPLVLDFFGPASGWLSGEFADAPTPTTLAADLGLDSDTMDEIDLDPLRDAVCEAYEAAADEAYWAELQRVAHLQVDA